MQSIYSVNDIMLVAVLYKHEMIIFQIILFIGYFDKHVKQKNKFEERKSTKLRKSNELRLLCCGKMKYNGIMNENSSTLQYVRKIMKWKRIIVNLTSRKSFLLKNWKLFK